MSLATVHGPNHHDLSNSKLSNFNRNFSSSEFTSTKVSSTMDLHINNGSSSIPEEPYQADEPRPETGFPVNKTGDTETFHDKKPVIMETSNEKRTDTAAATSAANSVSYPIILHTLLDDEDMFVGSGNQASTQMGDDREDRAPDAEDQVDDNGDEDEEDEEYEVMENTSDILGYFKGKISAQRERERERDGHKPFITSFGTKLQISVIMSATHQ